MLAKKQQKKQQQTSWGERQGKLLFKMNREEGERTGKREGRWGNTHLWDKTFQWG